MRISSINNSTSLRNNYSEIAFQSSYLKYLSAKNYISKTIKPKLEAKPNKIFDLWDFDIKKLEGIQRGIKVFKNMSMKEIAFYLATAFEFATFRGCFNNCAHCYADAKPPIKESLNQTSGMLWEDFTSLTEGIEKLNKRLGFVASGKLKRKKYRYLTPFHDSDCMEIYMKDKKGKVYDFIDIAKKLYKTMGIKVIFDTAGWNQNNKRYQERAEKYADFLSIPENYEMIDQFNISLNPFHSMHRKELELRKENKTEAANKIRDLYISRVANAVYTFTPLIKNKKLSFLPCAAPNKSNFEGYTIESLYQIYNDIIDKLEEMYKQDKNGSQKFVKTDDEIYQILKYLYDDFNDYRVIDFTEKAKKTMDVDKESLDFMERVLSRSYKEIAEAKRLKTFFHKTYGITDANGKYYITNFRFTMPTEIQLNFKNKKETASIGPNLRQDFLLTKKKIKELH